MTSKNYKESEVINMAVGLTNRNIQTGYCEFSYDDWDTDKDSIPNLDTPGKGVLSTIHSCCQGSVAVGTDGSLKILRGEDNSWIDF